METMKESINQPIRAVFIIAHPDDEAIPFGLPRALVEEGVDVELIALTKGDAGSHRIRSRRKLSQIRRREFKEAGSILGVSKEEILGLSDGHLDEQTRRAKKKLLRRLQKSNPDIVIVHNALDYHSDHRAAHEIGTWAVFHMPDSTRFFRRHKDLNKPVAVYEMDTQGSQTWQSYEQDKGGMENKLSPVSTILQISNSALEKSLRAFQAHKSQLHQRAEGLGYPELAILGAKRRGQQAGFTYGAGVTQITFGGYAFTTRDLLAEFANLQTYSFQT